LGQAKKTMLQDMPSSCGLHGHLEFGNDWLDWKYFWKFPISHKILNFGWKLMNNGLAMQENKRRGSMEIMDTWRVAINRKWLCMVWLDAHYPHAIWLREATRGHWLLQDEEQYVCVTHVRLSLLSTIFMELCFSLRINQHQSPYQH